MERRRKKKNKEIERVKSSLPCFYASSFKTTDVKPTKATGGGWIYAERKKRHISGANTSKWKMVDIC